MCLQTHTHTLTYTPTICILYLFFVRVSFSLARDVRQGILKTQLWQSICSALVEICGYAVERTQGRPHHPTASDRRRDGGTAGGWRRDSIVPCGEPRFCVRYGGCCWFVVYCAGAPRKTKSQENLITFSRWPVTNDLFDIRVIICPAAAAEVCVCVWKRAHWHSLYTMLCSTYQPHLDAAYTSILGMFS